MAEEIEAPVEETEPEAVVAEVTEAPVEVAEPALETDAHAEVEIAEGRGDRAAGAGRRPRKSPAAENPHERPVTIAVTGGIGAGKSEALRSFAREASRPCRPTRSSTG